MTFAEALDWAEIAPGRFAGTIDSSWMQGRGAFGGLLAGVMLRAMGRLTDRPPRTLTVHFCGPATGALELAVQVESAGRSVVQLSARITGAEGLVALGLATFAASRTSAVHVDADPAPAIVPWPGGVPLPNAEFIPVFARTHFEFRFGLGERLFSQAPRATTGGWLRWREPAPAEPASYAALLDAWPPGIFPVLSGPVTASSVDLTCQFFAPLPLEGENVNDPHIFLKTVQQAEGGYAEERGTLWTASGRPLARVRQLFAFFG